MVSFRGRDAQRPPGEGLPQWCSVSPMFTAQTPMWSEHSPRPLVNPPGEFEVLSGKASCLESQQQNSQGITGTERPALARKCWA